MIYTLISWRGIYPRVPKGVHDLNGINLVETHDTEEYECKENPKEKLLQYLKEQIDPNFEFMNVKDLTIR
jgi:hypothetical protein